MGKLRAIGTQDDVCDLPTRIERMRGALMASELAELLGHGRTTIYEWVKRGTIPYLDFGTSIRFDPVVTAKWLREREVNGLEWKKAA